MAGRHFFTVQNCLHIISLAFLGENQYTGEKGESNEEEILSVL